MLFDFAKLAPHECYKLLVSTVTPRPIAWVVSQDAKGKLNAAPFSFFNAFSGDPPILGFGIGSHSADRPKDTKVNIVATKQFVVNLVSAEMATAMNVTATEYPYGVDELQEAGLKTEASTVVKPPRIADSPVAFECQLMQIVKLGATQDLILGRILAMHIRDDSMLDVQKHHVDTPKLNLIGRMHGAGWYARTTDLFQMARIPLAEAKGYRKD